MLADPASRHRLCLLAALVSACLPGSISLGNDPDQEPMTTGGDGDAATAAGATGTSGPTTGAPDTTGGSTGPSTSTTAPIGSGTTDASTSTGGTDDTFTGPGDTSTDPGDTTAGVGESTSSAGDMTTSTSGFDSTGADTSSGTTGGDTGAPATCCFIPDAPNAAVSGMTPLGPVDLSWAWYGKDIGACPGLWFMTILADPNPEDYWMLRHLVLTVREQDWINGFQGVGPAFIQVAEDDFGTTYEGQIEIVSFDHAGPPDWCEDGDPVVMTGDQFIVKFTVKDIDNGWDLTGEVSAVYCPDFNTICV